MSNKEAYEFLKSDDAQFYMDYFQGSATRALAEVGGTLTEDNALKFCQCLWEQLPDRMGIRFGAFFRICEFAEEYCFGEDDDGKEDE